VPRAVRAESFSGILPCVLIGEGVGLGVGEHMRPAEAPKTNGISYVLNFFFVKVCHQLRVPRYC
jgi:hypothetical protein